MKEKSKRRSKVPILFLLLFIAIACYAGYQITSQLVTEYMENKAFNELLAQMQAGLPSDTQTGQEDVPGLEEEPGTEPGTQPEPGPTMLPNYAPLYQLNPDLFAWIRIDDTVINYPVVYTPADPEYYLHRAFDGSDSKSGVPFMDGRCFTDCGNYIVYGHHMKNGTMFKAITYYAEEEFWQDHTIVHFDTMYEPGTYEVIAAFYSKAYAANAKNVFRYYNYTNLTDEEVFDEYVAQVKEAALYDTGIEPVYGDQLLTLSTCEYHTTNGRFVVVARKIPEPADEV